MGLILEGAPERKALDAKRAEIRSKQADLQDVIDAEAADADLLDNCRKAVAAEMERGFPSGFDALRLSNSFLKAMDFPGMRPLANTKLPTLDWSALISFADALGRKLGMGDELSTQVVYEIAKHRRRREPGLPDADRQARIRQLHDELRSLERAEEREVLKLEAAGFHILRRDDIEPEVLFSVWSTYENPAGVSRNTEGAVDRKPIASKKPDLPEIAAELNGGAEQVQGVSIDASIADVTRDLGAR